MTAFILVIAMTYTLSIGDSHRFEIWPGMYLKMMAMKMAGEFKTGPIRLQYDSKSAGSLTVRRTV